MPIRLANKYIEALGKEGDRVATLQTVIETNLGKANACLSDWDKLLARANALTKDIHGSMNELNAMQDGLNKVVTALETLDDDLATTERTIGSQKADLKDLEHKYIRSKEQLERIYQMGMKRWSRPSALAASRQGFQVGTHWNTAQIQTFWVAQQQKIRWSPPFRYPLYQPVRIPLELVFEKPVVVLSQPLQKSSTERSKTANPQSITRKEKN
jgi:uncharacterized protein YoxC